MNILSNKLTLLNKVITLIAILFCINLPLIFIKNVSLVVKFFIIISIFLFVIYTNKIINKTNMKEELIDVKYKSRTKFSLLNVILGILFLSISELIHIAQYNIIFLLIIILLFALNLYTAYKSNTMAFTREGKQEQLKLLEFKHYITDYSLIKNSDLESVVIWDEYLAYSTAFGIPNKITDTIYEGWFNLNLNLQIIEKLII